MFMQVSIKKHYRPYLTHSNVTKKAPAGLASSRTLEAYVMVLW